MTKTTVGAEGSRNGPSASELYSSIPDMPSGPLDKYRKSSRFDWKLLKMTIEDPEMMRIKKFIWEELEKDKEFQHPLTTLPIEEQKRRAMRQLMKFHVLKYNIITHEMLNSGYIRKVKALSSLHEALILVNRSTGVKFALGVTLFGNSILRLGTERHLQYYEAAWRGELFGAFAVTEIAHGSNTKNLRTTATYNPRTKEFVLHTPDFEAAKCWSGNLGRTCTYALVFAQLITPDGENQGLHAFITPIRDPTTLLPYPGITVGEMGEKDGLNGIDNGFLIFNQYKIPKDCLLNRTGDVNADGLYETSFTNPQQVLGAALEALTMGRVGITQEASLTLCCAITIGIRYGAVRRQFGPKNEEIPILEYPLHQWRLFPYLAAAVLLRVFIMQFLDKAMVIIEDSMSPSSKQANFTTVIGEIHAISSSCKPLVTWVCRDAIQEVREACGGHGYLKAANLGELRSDHDPAVTYEGDNNVLNQQTSNWLLRQAFTDREYSRESPLQTTRFLERFDFVLNYKFVGNKTSDVISHNFIYGAYEWLLCWLIKETHQHISSLQSKGVDKFSARAQAQVYKARTLSLAYAENNVLNYTWEKLNEPGVDSNVKIVLEKLYLIYGLWCIDRHLTYFYQGGFAEGPHLASLVRDGLISLCKEILPDSISIVDAIAPPDFALNSVLAYADGNLYENLKKRLLKEPGAMERASWWKDAVPSVISKL